MNIGNFISKQNWIFAKTYAKSAPHEYCLLKNVSTDEGKKEFIDFSRIIRNYGFPANFYSKKNFYFYWNGYFYWTMDELVEDTDLINRCRVEDYDLTFYPKILKKGGA